MDTVHADLQCHNISDADKLKYMFTNENLLDVLANTCFNNLNERRDFFVFRSRF